jgi:hypothetical protein
VKRRQFFVASGIVAHSILSPRHVRASSGSEYFIKRTAGYEISNDFGAAETRLLTDGLAHFYQGFLQPHWTKIPELSTDAGSLLADNFDRTDYDGVIKDSREYMYRQFIRMDQRGTDDVFPKVTLQYGLQENGDWVARTYPNTVQVHSANSDNFARTGRYSGEFRIQVNDFYVNNRKLGRHYADPMFWAGVIAHEAIHDLGHLHLKRRSDDGYYLYQLTLIEHLVMTYGRARYGMKNGTPCLCQRR